jgi:hypothetical protein
MFWPQDWHLFSPNPPTTESTFLIQCRSNSGQQTAWLDLTAAPKKDAFSQPLGPAPKLRYVINGMVDTAVQNILIVEESSCIKSPIGTLHAHGCKEAVNIEKVKLYRETPGYSALRRYAYKTCKNRLTETGNDFVREIKIRYAKTYSFPFTERKLIGTRSQFRSEHYDFPVEHFSESSVL